MRKKLSIIAIAALVLFTAQCKKNEPKPEEKVMVPITGTVDFGGGSKTIIGIDGSVQPVNGDIIYIYDNGNYVGSLTCKSTSTSKDFSIIGEIENTSLNNTCVYMYLGSNNDTNEESTTISFANQTDVMVSENKIDNLNKFHVASCKATVTNNTVVLHMENQMAIAYFQLYQTNSEAVIDQQVTVKGVLSTAPINKVTGTITKIDATAEDITVKTDNSGCFYMALIPQAGPVTFHFFGKEQQVGEIGSISFNNGITASCLYCKDNGDPLEVKVLENDEEPPFKL